MSSRKDLFFLSFFLFLFVCFPSLIPFLCIALKTDGHRLYREGLADVQSWILESMGSDNICARVVHMTLVISPNLIQSLSQFTSNFCLFSSISNEHSIIVSCV